VADFPDIFARPQRIILTTTGWSQPVGNAALATRTNSPGSGAWPAAKRAIFVPVIVEVQMTINQLAVLNGATISGNVDLGIYSYPGSGTAASRLVSIGATAQAGESKPQVFNIADTALKPGLYYFAMVATSATAAIIRSTAEAKLLQVCGVQQQAGLESLPETATFSNPGSSYAPMIAGIGAPTF